VHYSRLLRRFTERAYSKGLGVAKIRCKNNSNATVHSEQGRAFLPEAAADAVVPELLSILPHDRGRRFQANTDAA
jgi:hypothetical protein